MKKYFLVAAGMLSLFSACKEKPPVIKYGADTAKDTTYVSSVPAPQARNVLVEEYTGATCTNCPAAHEVLKEYQAANPGRINVIGLYIKGPIQTVPPHDAAYDFRHNDATTISKDIFLGVTQLPSAGIDRSPVGGNIKVDRGSWGSAIEHTLTSVPDSINLSLESTYDPATEKATIIATIAYPYAITFAHNLSLVLVQDSIIDVQEYPSTDPVHPGKNEHYVFTNVLRTLITEQATGDPIYTSIPAKEPGRVIVRVYTYDTKKLADRLVTPGKKPPFKAEHCRVIGFISYGGTGSYRVLQSAQTTLM